MSIENSDNNRTATEWMEFYEKLFKENDPVKNTPLPLNGVEEEETEGLLHDGINSLVHKRNRNVYKI